MDNLTLLKEVTEYCENLGVVYKETTDGIRSDMKKSSTEGSIFLTFYAETNEQGILCFSVGGRQVEHITINWEEAKEKLYAQKIVWYND